MRIISFEKGGHSWVKTNLVTQGKHKSYDTYRCSQCGMQAKSYQLGCLSVREFYANRIDRCPGLKVAKRVVITQCNAVGPQFANLTPGSEHDIISPPAGYDNKRGEWVMGIGEPVMLLYEEFYYQNNEQRTGKD